MNTVDGGAKDQVTIRSSKQAFEAYLRARRRAWLAQALGALAGRSRHLRPLERSRSAGQRSVGLQSVPIRAIRGSENRTRDFDLDFNPLTEHTQERWIRLYRAWQDGAQFPPVSLTRQGETYYVRDGHHRISIARSLGQEYIEAEVTERE